MKLLTILMTFFTLSTALAENGTIESYFSAAADKSSNVVHVYLQNNCYQDVFIATRSQNPNGAWETKGYMRLFPGQVAYGMDTLNNMYYLNAFTGDGRIRWEGEHRFDIHGRSVRALLIEVPKDYAGNWTTILFCR